MRYLVQPRDQIIVKCYGFLSFVKNMSKNIGKNNRKILSGIYNYKVLDLPKESATETVKTSSKNKIRKTTEATGDLNGNKITNKIIKFLKT